MNWGVKIGKKIYYCGDREAKLLQKTGYKPSQNPELALKANKFLSNRILAHARKKMFHDSIGKQLNLGGFL